MNPSPLLLVLLLVLARTVPAAAGLAVGDHTWRGFGREGGRGMAPAKPTRGMALAVAPGKGFGRSSLLQLASEPGEQAAAAAAAPGSAEATETLLVTAPSDPLATILVGRRSGTVPLRIANRSDRPQSIQARWSLTALLDPDTRRTGKAATSVGAGAERVLPLALTFPDRGYYEVRVWVEGSRGGRASLLLPFALIDPPRRDEVAPDSPFGINARLPDPQALRLMKLAGIQMFRGEMRWDALEPKPGELDTRAWDRVMADARAAKVLVLPVVGHPPTWAMAKETEADLGTRPRDVAEYLALLERLARRYQDVRVWEIWNEPDLTWSGTPEEYGQMVAAARDTLRRVNPALKIALGGSSKGDVDSGLLTFTDGAMRASSPEGFDLLSVHPSAPPRSPEEGHLYRKLLAATNHVASRGAQRPIWVTEIGWPTAGDASSVPEALQAAYLVRAYVLSLSARGVEKVFWSQLVSGAGSTPQEQYGILRADLRPKPAYAAYAHMAHQLEGARLDQVLLPGGATEGYLFRTPEGEAVAVLWSTGDPVELRADLPRGTLVTAMDGRRIEVGRRKPLPLSATPIYVRFPRHAALDGPGALINGEFSGVAPLALAGNLTAEGQLAVRLTNQMARIVAIGDVGARAEGDWGLPEQERPYGAIPPGWTVTVLMDTQLPKSDAPSTLTALVLARTGDVIQSARMPLRLMTARRLHHPVSVDGDLAEWSDVPTLFLGSPEWVAPAWARDRWKGPDDLSAHLAWAWDDRALYLSARVTDDVHSQRAPANAMWRGDSLQVALDARCDAQTPAYDGNDSEIGLGLVAGRPVAYRWVGPHPKTTGPVPAIALAIRREGRETRYEAAIPWEEIGVTARPGMLLGACVVVNEDDGSGRDHWLETSPGMGENRDPRGYWRVRLGE